MFNSELHYLFSGEKKCLLMIMMNNQCWKSKNPYDQINLLYNLSVFA